MDIKQSILDSINVLRAMVEKNEEHIRCAAEIMVDAVLQSHKILWCGNGGSAADAQHMAAELMGGLRNHDRDPIPSIALTTDSSFITAWANDTDYNSIFSRQLEALGESGDVLIAISTSGNSKNVLNAIHIAKERDMKVVVLTGLNGGTMAEMGSCSIVVPSEDTQRIQEGHLVVEHLLCEIVEEKFNVKNSDFRNTSG